MSLVDYEHSIEEPEDIESATFEQFMDENGILWELSDTLKDRSVPNSLRQQDPEYTIEIKPSNQMGSNHFTQQADYDFQRRGQSELSGVAGKPESRQRVQDRSKSAESIQHDRLSLGVRNRSMSPRVRFSDQKQYWPCSEDANKSSSLRSQDPQYDKNSTPKSSGSQSEKGIPENSSNSVTDIKPDFEKLWLRDVSIGTTTPSVESFVPFQTRSSRPVMKQKNLIKASGQTKDQGCQPFKDSSTQTWLLDFPLSLDDLGSVSQRSSFVRSRRPEYPINPLPVSRNEVKGVNTDVPVGKSTTSENPLTQRPPYNSNEQRYDIRSSFLDPTSVICGSPSSISEVQNHFLSQNPQVQSQCISSAQKSEQKEISTEVYKPSHLSVNTKGRLCDGIGGHSSISDSNEQSRDSESSEKIWEESNRRNQSSGSKNGKEYTDYRSSKLKNIKYRRNGQFPDSRYSRDERFDQSQASKFKKERRNKYSPDSTDSEYANDHHAHNAYLYRRGRESGRSKNSRESMSSSSKYRNGRDANSSNRNDQSVDRDYRKKRQGRKNDYSPKARFRNIDRDDCSDEYEDSQGKDDNKYKSRRKHFHKRKKRISNSSDDLDRDRKTDRLNFRSSSRSDISSNSVYDSQDSVHSRTSVRNPYSETRSSVTLASKSPMQGDPSMTSGNTHSESLNMQLTLTSHDKQDVSDLSAISIPNHEANIHSDNSRTFSESHISDQRKPDIDTEMIEPGIKDSFERNGDYLLSSVKDQISDEIVPVNVQYDSDYEKTDIISAEICEDQKHRHAEDAGAEQIVAGNHVHVVMDTDDQYSLYSIGSSSLSRTSSQESLLDNIPKSRREAVRQRRLALYLVFRYLDTKTLGRVAGVSREWKKVSRQSSLWKQVHLSHTRCTSKTLETLARWCTQLESLHLEDVYTRKQLELESDEDYAQAVRASLEAGVECLLQVSESTLKSITIINCPHVLTDKCMWLASCYSRMLQDVCYHSNTYILGADVLWALGAGCGLIQSLDIAPLYPCANTEKFTNKCLQIIAQSLPGLDRLCIGGQQVDINGFVLIAKSCQRLYSLSLHGCVDVVEDVAVAMCRKGLKNLRSLDFSHTPVTDKALLHFYSCCKHLKSIHVSFCLEDVTTDPELKENAENFNKRIKALEKLKKKGGLWNILKLDVQKVQD
ncbi:uncharacterized protein LOC117339217 [Pecten maximus]|uniref:uncharacterized protein LOC117339217 n=1 Tax=Pecten maximus TaxID=6579 RepID=UPI0014583A13|nr:uncharacterized protein LOC117339217 [Pecten maximus]